MGIDFLTRGLSPWGQSVLTHISWDLLWVSFFAGVVFLAAHSVYMLLSAHSKRASSEVDALEVKLKGLPEKVQRHSLAARVFHWIMAASMFTLLFTSFLPIVGVQFAWVQWHWIAGLVLTASILYHIVHAIFFMDFWSIGLVRRTSRSSSPRSCGNSGATRTGRSRPSIRSATGSTTSRSS